MEHGILLVGGYHLESDESSRLVYQLDLRNEKWVVLAEIPRQRTVSCGVVVRDGVLFVIGGHDGVTCEFSLSCDSLNLATLEWKNKPSLLHEPTFINGFAEFAQAVVFTGDAVQQADKTKMKIQSRSRVYTLLNSSGLMDDIPQLPQQKRTEVPIATAQNSIMTCGGYDEQGLAVSETLLLSPQEMTEPHWTTVAPLAIPRGSHGLINGQSSGRTYAVGGTWLSGGRHSFRCCEVYDVGTNRWTFIRGMDKPRRNFGVASLDSQIFVFGGFDGVEGIFFDSEVYDERSGRWRRGPDVPQCLWNYAVAS